MGKYDDMLQLPHHVSAKHPQMNRQDRAAQFSPFAALVGLDVALQETARVTEQRITLDEYEQAALDAKLQQLRDALPTRPRVTATYFVPDALKEGGAYHTTAGRAKKLTEENPRLVLEDGEEIPLGDLVALIVL